MGYTLQEAKACTRRGFQEYDSIPNPDQRDLVSAQYFGGTTTVSRQLKAFAESETSHLHAFPEAFVDVQEASFGSSHEKFTESMHVRTRRATRRGDKISKPASTCARQRKDQHIALVDDELDWLVGHWDDRTICAQLLEHIKTPEELHVLTLAKRDALVYGYSQEQHFDEETPAQMANLLAVKDALDGVQQKEAIPFTTSVALVVSFFKGCLEVDAIFVAPNRLFGMLVDERPVVPTPCQPKDLVPLLAPEATVDIPVAERTYFQIISPRPENKFKLRQSHLARDRSQVLVRTLVPLVQADGSTHLHAAAGTVKSLRLTQWASPDTFAAVMQALARVHVEPGALSLDTVRRCLSIEDAAPCLAIEDADAAGPAGGMVPPCLAIEAADAAAGPAGAMVPAHEVPAGAIVPATTMSGLLECPAMSAFLDKKAFAENGHHITMSESENAEGPEALIHHGIVQCGVDPDFAEAIYAVKLGSIFVQGSLKLVASQPVAAGPDRLKHAAKWDKLESIRALLRRGWCAKEDASLEAYHMDGPKELLLTGSLGPKTYFTSLLLSGNIFAKPGGVARILHGANDYYYRLLLDLPDLSPLQELPAETLLRLRPQD